MTSFLTFEEKLKHRIDEIQSILCVGLDPHIHELFPPNHNDDDDDPQSSWQYTEDEICQRAYTFCKTIIEQTQHITVCYKPNIAFFEALSSTHGMMTLHRVLSFIPSYIPILLDVKRGDIGTTANAYAQACYDSWSLSSTSSSSSSSPVVVDAVTLSPLMGYDSIEPFITGKL
jgi:orotidine 5'-phosphate decarboxylase subfamily 2